MTKRTIIRRCSDRRFSRGAGDNFGRAGAGSLRLDNQARASPACRIAVDAAVSLPAQLEGLEVFVRVNAGSEAAALAALTQIEQKGGRPALLVSGIPGPLTTDVRDHVGRIVIDLPPQPPDQSDDVFSFSLKTSLTALRASDPRIDADRTRRRASALALASVARRRLLRGLCGGQRCGATGPNRH